MNSTKVSAITSSGFGTTSDGHPTEVYTLSNENGAQAKVTTFGATLTELWMPDKDGKPANVILGFDNAKSYEAHTNPHFGGTIGRYANRIAGGTFKIGGEVFTLAKNNGPNSLHGGVQGWDRKVWKAEPVITTEGPSIKFECVSADGEEGFPGEVHASVSYTLTTDNALKIVYSATTNKSTPINMTNHAYFNLAGAGNGDVLNHRLTLEADSYTPVDDTLIPTGEIASVKGTPLDFTVETPLGARISQLPHGYDHNYVLSLYPRSLSLAATVVEPTSGRRMQVWTTEPGIQLYTAYWLDGSLKGNGGVYNRFYAFCLETQHFPDSPNKPSFATAIVNPGEQYTQTTIYKFSANK